MDGGVNSSIEDIVNKKKAEYAARVEQNYKEQEALSLGVCPDCGGNVRRIIGFYERFLEWVRCDRIVVCDSCSRKHRIYVVTTT